MMRPNIDLNVVGKAEIVALEAGIGDFERLMTEEGQALPVEVVTPEPPKK